MLIKGERRIWEKRTSNGICNGESRELLWLLWLAIRDLFPCGMD